MNEPLAPFLEVGPEGLYCPALEARLRPDKTAAQADTLQTVAEIYGGRR